MDYEDDWLEVLNEKGERETILTPILTKQSEITEKMWVILVDWLREVTKAWNGRLNTHEQAIEILNHYLQHIDVRKEDFQKVGICAYWLGTKMVDRDQPATDEIPDMATYKAEDLVYITAQTYTFEEIVECEFDIFERLDYHLTYVSPHDYQYHPQVSLVDDIESWNLMRRDLEFYRLIAKCARNIRAYKYTPLVRFHANQYIWLKYHEKPVERPSKEIMECVKLLIEK